jgi:hypothetical protein
MNMYTVVFGVVPKALQSIVDRNVKRWGMAVVTLKALADPTPEALTVAADNYRWERAANAPEIELYCDIDCRWLGGELHSPALPYWPLDHGPTTPQPDAFLMWVPRDFAQAVLDASPDRSVYCWPRKVLRDWKGINQIPDSCYEHEMYSTHKRRAELRRSTR